MEATADPSARWDTGCCESGSLPSPTREAASCSGLEELWPACATLLYGLGQVVALIGLGFVWAAAVGLICAVCVGGTSPTFCDSLNARNHWRGHLQGAAALMIVGIIGTIIQVRF